MVNRIISSYFYRIASRFGGDFAEYKGLSKLNGDQILTGGPWKNLEINGRAILGKQDEKTLFEDILVVNGDFKANHCKFDLVDVRGSFSIDHSVIEKEGLFSGDGNINNCVAKTLNLKSPGHLLVKDSKITGDLHYSSLGYKTGNLVLDNTIVTGSVITPKGDGKKVSLINNAKATVVEEN